MNKFTTPPEDYPFQFNQEACNTCNGKCCRVGGYVWITQEELEEIAEFRKMDLDRFYTEYVRLVQGKLSLQERLINGEYICCLFDPIDNKCTIYQYRPQQCKTYPFWEQYKWNPTRIQEACPGVILKEGN